MAIIPLVAQAFGLKMAQFPIPSARLPLRGNLLEMYASLIPANDLKFRGATNAPSVLIPTMTIAGD